MALSAGWSLRLLMPRLSGRRVEAIDKDPRLHRIRLALEAILDPDPGRAERVQQIFSLEYDPKWERPQPRY
jgi:hypothetical protein